MQNALAPTPDDLARLLKAATDQGCTIMVVPGQQQRELPLTTALRLRLGLQPAEGRALSKLVESDHVTRREMHIAMSGVDCPVSDPRSINTTICQLRKKLQPHGIEIVTRRKLGHQLLADSKAKVRELLGADIADAARCPPATRGPGGQNLKLHRKRPAWRR